MCLNFNVQHHMESEGKSIRVPYNTLKTEFARILMKYGFDQHQAEKCAEIFAINSRDGINSHGLNRFPRFIKNTISIYETFYIESCFC